MTSCSTRSSSPRSWRPASRSRIGEIAVPTRYFEEASLGRLPAQRRVRPVDPAGGRSLPPPPPPTPALAQAGRPPPLRLIAEMRISRNALLRGTLGIAISVVAIWVLIGSVDIQSALQVLATASPAWIAVMLVTCLVDIGARGARWRALLAPIAPLPYRTVLGYTYIGYLANNVLPARLGELYRSHALGEGEGVSRPRSSARSSSSGSSIR